MPYGYVGGGSPSASEDFEFDPDLDIYGENDTASNTGGTNWLSGLKTLTESAGNIANIFKKTPAKPKKKTAGNNTLWLIGGGVVLVLVLVLVLVPRGR